jgi:hypothetical protein
MAQMNAWCGGTWSTADYTQTLSAWFLPERDAYSILNPWPDRESAQLRIINADGREVVHTELRAQQTLSISRQTLVPGVYTAIIVSASGRSMHRFIHCE